MKKIPGPLPVHIIGCIAFLSLPVLFSPDVSWSFHFFKVRGFQRDFFAYTLLLIFFYFNYFYLLPRFYFKQKLLVYATGIALAYCVITFLPNIFLPVIHPVIFAPPGHNIPPETMQMPYGPPSVTFRELGQHLFQFLIILSLSIMFRTNLPLKLSAQNITVIKSHNYHSII